MRLNIGVSNYILRFFYGVLLLAFPINEAVSACFYVHVNIITSTGKMLDRPNIDLSIENSGIIKGSKKDSTDSRGIACIPYNEDTVKPGDEVKLLLGVPGKDTKEGRTPWSTWKLLSPYQGVAYLPNIEKARMPLEIIIAPQSVVTSLMSYRSADEGSKVKNETCASSANSSMLQIIALKNKERAELLVNSLRQNQKYSACLSSIVTAKGVLYRVRVEIKEPKDLQGICVDIKRNYLLDSDFSCDV